MRAYLKFEPRDLWVGVYWRRKQIHLGDPPVIGKHDWEWKVYVCLLPCFPIVFSWIQWRGSRNRATLSYVEEDQFGWPHGGLPKQGDVPPEVAKAAADVALNIIDPRPSGCTDDGCMGDCDANRLLHEWEERHCPDGLLPDGETCPRCGGNRAPSGVDGGTWVHHEEPR